MSEESNKVRKILDEHLSAINDNTTEIQVLFDYLQDVEKKMDSLGRRLDALQLEELSFGKLNVSPLGVTEKKIFLILYTEAHPLTFEEIACKSGVQIHAVRANISSLSEKGVPLQRSFTGGQFFFSLNKDFKDMQAKENVVNLSLQSFL